jgi:putative nucleotidyltransferase with HDIG domain
MSKATLYVWTVNAVGVAIITAALADVIRSPIDVRWLVLAILAVVSGATVLRLRFVSASFSVGDAFSFAALFLYGVEAATLTVALDTLGISLRLKRSPARTAFNVAAPCLAMWSAGVAVFHGAHLPLPVDAVNFVVVLLAVASSVAIMFIVSSWLIASAVALHEDRSIARVWWDDFAQLWANPLACGYVGALMAIGVDRFGVAALIAIVPIPLILYFAFRAGLGRIDDHLSHLSDLNRMHQATIEAFATAVDAKDQVTHGHIRRVQAYCLALARDLKADDVATLKALEAAALLHDVGKIGIPEHILNKPGRLTPAEFEVMKQHVAIGLGILSAVEFPFPVLPIIGNHHENWDGSGYPNGVQGEAIPLGARILSVVDCFDALTSDRPYRAAISDDEAFDILRARRGNMYDPQVVDRFILLRPDLPIVSERAGSEDVAESLRPLVQRADTSSPAERAIAQMIVEMLAMALSDNLCVAYEVDTESASVVASAAAGPGAADVTGHRVALGHGVSGWTSISNSPVMETDAVFDFPHAHADSPLRTQRCTSVPLSLVPPLIVTVYGPSAQAAARTFITARLAEVIGQLVNRETAPKLHSEVSF